MLEESARVLTRVEVEPLPHGAGLTVVVNPSSGSSDADDFVEEIRKALPAARVVEPSSSEDVDAELRAQVDACRALGIAGGDGSVGAAASIAAEARKPLFVVPAGTLNHFARDLGVDSVAEAARAVLEGTAISVDRGVIDGRTFLNTASFGTYAEVVDARESIERRIGKWPALAVALARVLRTAEPTDVEIDGRREQIWLAFIGNCCYTPLGLAPRHRSRLDDGNLDVRLVHASLPWARTRVIGAALIGRVAHSRAFSRRVVGKLRIRCSAGPLRLASDGETFEGHSEVVVRKAPEPLTVYAPV